MSGRGRSRGSFGGSNGARGGRFSSRGSHRRGGKFHAGSHRDGASALSNRIQDNLNANLERKKKEAKYGAAEFIRKAREDLLVQKRIQHRSENKKDAKKARIDRKVKSIMIGKKKWNESTDESNWCKLSCKIFGGSKKSIKITIDTRSNGSILKYRTDITFDDVTWFSVRR